jgi:3-methyl-2-oxobutanoate hydroxymethyltransferase
MAQIVDRAGVDLVSVGDTVGINLWGQPNPLEVTMDEMIVVAKAVRRGRPAGAGQRRLSVRPAAAGHRTALQAAIRFVKSRRRHDQARRRRRVHHAVRAISRAGIPVFAQFGITPQTALQMGVDYKTMLKTGRAACARGDGDAGRAGPAPRGRRCGADRLHPLRAGRRTGGDPGGRDPGDRCLGGGPWLDGRMRMAHAAIGYAATQLDSPAETYANVARTALEAISAYADDVRGARQIKGGIRVPPAN